MKKRILCFGDSNTWGCIPGTRFKRFSENERFTKLLQKMLGSGFEVIEEGLYARTLASEYQRTEKEGRNGSTYLIPCLLSHDPLNMVIIMLGTTEVKKEFHNSPEVIGKYLENYYIKVILKNKSFDRGTYPRLMIICPPIINESKASKIYEGGEKMARKLGETYSKIAKKHKCLFIDASHLSVGSDGVHMTKESHKELAKIIAKNIRNGGL
jgi:lysophospholipase L1-like esterase